jgi:hypothetical protein
MAKENIKKRGTEKIIHEKKNRMIKMKIVACIKFLVEVISYL